MPGSKYDKQLTGTQISAAIKRDLKAAVAAGELPNATFSVRLQTYAGGRSIRVQVSKLPEDFRFFDPDYLRHEHATKGHAYWRGHRHSPERIALEKKIEAIGNAYNFNNSDIATDYFHVNYYLSVSLDWREERERKKVETERALGFDRHAAEDARAEQEQSRHEAREHELSRELAPHEHPVQVSMARRQARAPVRMGLSATLEALAEQEGHRDASATRLFDWRVR